MKRNCIKSFTMAVIFALIAAILLPAFSVGVTDDRGFAPLPAEAASEDPVQRAAAPVDVTENG